MRYYFHSIFILNHREQREYNRVKICSGINTVEVDARSVDGPVVLPVTATCAIDVGIVEDGLGPVSCEIWQPPNWELEHYGYGSDLWRPARI